MIPKPEYEPFAARAPSPADRAEILQLAASAGAHGVYVGNDLARDVSGEAMARHGLGFYGQERTCGYAWFGARGNLVVLLAAGSRLDGRRVARAIGEAGFGWRIALGPEAVIDALAAQPGVTPLLRRRQLYYVAAPDAVRRVAPDPRARLAEVADVDALVAASLALNQADLHLDPTRVSRRWLVRTTRERVRAQTAWAVGPPGAPYAKLDVGSEGCAGVVIEGVFTAPEHRDAGWATGLVHAVVHRQLSAGRSPVCLHVAESNAAARRCYEKAGMEAAMAVGLLLRES